MPTYEYECKKCGYRFEEFQSITAEPRKTCAKPKCRGRVQRLIGTGGGLLFKGSGFYETDYRSESYQKAAKAESEGGKSSGDSKTDSGKAQTDGGKAKNDGGKSKTAKAD